MKLSALLSLMPTLRRVKGIALDVGAGKKAPSEFKIFSKGDVETSKGTFTFDDEAAASVMAAFKAQGNPLCMDYEHQMAMNEDGGPMPAACFFNLELRDDGSLWAIDVDWSKPGRELVENGEYKFFSPWLEFEKDTGKICRLMNLAMTNMPATKNMQAQLALLSSRPTADKRSKSMRVALSGMLTFDQIRDAVQSAVRAMMPDTYPWVCDIYDDAVIVDTSVTSARKLYRIPYEMIGAKCVLGDEVTEVIRAYLPIDGMTGAIGGAAAPAPGATREPVPTEDDLTELVTCGAVPFQKGEVDEGDWDASAATMRMRKLASKDGSGDKAQMKWSQYAKGFAHVDGDGQHFGQYSFPHHDVKDGKLVVSKKGVEAAAESVKSAKLPEADLADVKKHLDGHFKQWGAKAPWIDSDASSEESLNMNKLLLSSLGLPETTTDAQLVAHLVQMKSRGEDVESKLLSISGGKDADAAFATLSSLKDAVTAKEAEILVFKAKAVEAEAVALSAKVDGLVAQGMAEGQITPAQKDFWTAHGKKDVAMLSNFLATAPKIVGGAPVRPPGGGAPTGITAEGELSEVEMQVCLSSGHKPEDWKAYKADRTREFTIAKNRRPGAAKDPRTEPVRLSMTLSDRPREEATLSFVRVNTLLPQAQRDRVNNGDGNGLGSAYLK